MKPEGDITKLPKWAQSHIRVLEMRLREEKERNRIIDAGESDTMIVNWDSLGDTALPNGTAIRFMLDNGGVVRVQARGEYVDVNTNMGELTIHSRAANSVHLRVSP